jgi:hypothetical protein
MLVFEWNFLGLSSETKPLNNEKVINGSTFYECDTSNFFIYYNGEWYKQTFVTDDGINVYLYKFLMRKMFKNAFDTNISKTHVYNPEISSNITFTSVLPSNITEMEMYGDTEQQTYTGKNLWKPAPDGTNTQGGITSVRENGVITLSGTSTSTSAGTSPFYDLDTPLPAGTYTFSIPNPLPYKFEFVMQDSNGTNHFLALTAGSTSNTVTTTWETVKIRNGIGDYSVGTEINLTIEKLQLESGSTATAYEPYVGGIPAPNPDYPQEIQTVTGEQTVTVSDGTNSQSYTVDLGTTELCKIDDYQDYIYKSGADWYVHKEVSKYTFDGTETWTSGVYGVNSWYLRGVLSFPYDTSKVQIISNLFMGVSNNDRNTGNNVIYTTDSNTFWIRNTSLLTLAQVQAATNGNYVYYALATPTDTQITDTELISSLNSIMSYTFPEGLNYITVSGSNLPALLKLTIIEKE